MNMVISPQNFTCTCGCNPCCCPDLRQQMLAIINDPASGVMQTIINNIGVLGVPVPTKGVTDGSDAGPGEVGEIVGLQTAPFSYAANPAVTTNIVTGPVIPPGDWDMWAFMAFSSDIGGAVFYVNPVPAGMNSDLIGALTISTPPPTEIEEFLVLPGVMGRGSFTVPTLLAFTTTVFQNTFSGLPAGTATLTVQARRRR